MAVIGVTPGWLRSERMLENFGVSEANWRDACRDRPGFADVRVADVYRPRRCRARRRQRAERWKGSIVSARQLGKPTASQT